MKFIGYDAKTGKVTFSCEGVKVITEARLLLVGVKGMGEYLAVEHDIPGRKCIVGDIGSWPGPETNGTGARLTQLSGEYWEGKSMLKMEYFVLSDGKTLYLNGRGEVTAEPAEEAAKAA